MKDTKPVAPDDLAYLTDAEFIAHWRAIVGEPPAIMLESRAEMIRVLIEHSSRSVPPRQSWPPTPQPLLTEPGSTGEPHTDIELVRLPSDFDAWRKL